MWSGVSGMGGRQAGQEAVESKRGGRWGKIFLKKIIHTLNGSERCWPEHWLF